MEIPIHTKLEQRVYSAAEATLDRQHYVSAIDVLCGMGLLASSAVDSWRKGRTDFLEREIQGGLNKISSSMAIFRRWAHEKGLKASETDYVRSARSGTVRLQLSLSGDPQIEKNCSDRARRSTGCKPPMRSQCGCPPMPVANMALPCGSNLLPPRRLKRRISENEFPHKTGPARKVCRMKMKTFAAALFACGLAAYSQVVAHPIPRVVQQNGRYALMVDGAPFLVLGAQANNSSDWPATLPKVWPAIEYLHANTLEIPIY